MRSRLVACGSLAGLVLLVMAVPAEAFGRRSSATRICTPVYCHPVECWPCPPYPHPHPVPVGWDCLVNYTDKVLRVHITSGYGHFETVLHPRCCAVFPFVKDNKPRVLSAFTLDNTLIDLVTFTPYDHGCPSCTNCFPVIQSQPAAPAAKGEERKRVQGDGTLPFAPSGQAI